MLESSPGNARGDNSLKVAVIVVALVEAVFLLTFVLMKVLS